MRQFVIDTQWFRTRSGLGVLAGSPLTQFTVTKAGAGILNSLETGGDLPPGHEPLTSRLLATGAIHPVVGAQASISEVTVVIPTYCTNDENFVRLRNLVASLHGLPIIVVDDASPLEFSLDGVRLIRHDVNAGPGAARNTGVHHVTTPFVVFIDDDVTIDCATVLDLAGLLLTGAIHFVAPRVRSQKENSAIDDYEQFRSSLDLGSIPAVVRPTSRVSYVPSAVLACNVQSLLELNGFDEALRVGEDVDFVWRASEHGKICRYEPSLTCAHQSRETIADFVRQRFSYGSSAAALDQRHRLAVAPLRTHLLLLAPPALFFSGFFLWSIPAFIVSYLWFFFSLQSTRLTFRHRLRVITIGLTSTTRLLLSAVARTWWPIFFLLSFFFNPIALLFAVSVIVPPLADLVTKRPRHPARYVVLHIVDNFSYGLGVWAGAVLARSPRCLLPAITLRSGRLRSKG